MKIESLIQWKWDLLIPETRPFSDCHEEGPRRSLRCFCAVLRAFCVPGTNEILIRFERRKEDQSPTDIVLGSSTWVLLRRRISGGAWRIFALTRT